MENQEERSVLERNRLKEDENERIKNVLDVTWHDVRNSLSVIAMAVEIIQETDDLERIKSLAVNSILSSQRAISGAIEFTENFLVLGNRKKCWNSIYEIIRRITRQFPLEVKLSNNFPQKLEICCDPLIEKVFYNLIENAVQHGKASSIECSVEQKGDFVISIKDNGSGIEESQKEMIFKQGFGKNTGYGLFFCKEVIGQSDMTIKEVGDRRGACFVIGVPEYRCRIRNELNT
ncbi:MAG: ATP-binding protein [Candidatus Paceibacterota bacterium]